MNDPDFREAYASLNDADLSLVDDIALQVNNKIAQRVAAAPFFYRYFNFFAGAALTGLLVTGIWIFSHENKVNVQTPLVAHEKNVLQQHEKLQEQVAEARAEEEILEENHITNDIKTSQSEMISKNMAESSREPLGQDLKKTEEPVNSTDKKPETVVNASKEPENKTDNTRNFEDESNKMVFLRMGGAEILSKVNAYDAQGNKTDNKAVNDPNIGSKTTTKVKNNSYSLNDMPSYPGGDAGYQAYLIRKLHNLIYIRKKDAVYDVNVQFTVSAKGNVEDVEIIGDIPSLMEKEIVRVVKDAQWNAGKKSGKKGALEVMVNLQFY